MDEMNWKMFLPKQSLVKNYAKKERIKISLAFKQNDGLLSKDTTSRLSHVRWGKDGAPFEQNNVQTSLKRQLFMQRIHPLHLLRRGNWKESQNP